MDFADLYMLLGFLVMIFSLMTSVRCAQGLFIVQILTRRYFFSNHYVESNGSLQFCADLWIFTWSRLPKLRSNCSLNHFVERSVISARDSLLLFKF